MSHSTKSLYFYKMLFVARSPVYSHLTATLQGLTTIRAFGAQEILKQEFDGYQNAYSSAYFMFLGANRTFGFWLDMHCVAFISMVTFSFLVFENSTDFWMLFFRMCNVILFRYLGWECWFGNNASSTVNWYVPMGYASVERIGKHNDLRGTY